MSSEDYSNAPILWLFIAGNNSHENPIPDKSTEVRYTLTQNNPPCLGLLRYLVAPISSTAVFKTYGKPLMSPAKAMQISHPLGCSKG